MILQIQPLSVTTIGSSPSPIANCIIQLFNKDGETILDESLDVIEEGYGDNDTIHIKDIDSLNYEVQYKRYSNTLLLDVKVPFVFNKFQLGIKIINGTETFYNIFTFYGYDTVLPIYLLSSALQVSNQTYASFKIIENPLSNVRHIYRTNNSKYTSLEYRIGDKVVSRDKEFSITVTEIEQLKLHSKYKWKEGNTFYNTTHISEELQLNFYNHNPEINILSDYVGDLTINKELQVQTKVDFTEQAHYEINGESLPIGLNYLIEICIYDKGESLVYRQLKLNKYVDGNPTLVNIDSDSMELIEQGCHRIEVNYSIMGKIPNYTTYPKGKYMVAQIADYDGEEKQLGDIIELAEELPKSSTHVLIPIFDMNSELVEGMSYFEPYNNDVINNTSQVYLAGQDDFDFGDNDSGVTGVVAAYQYKVDTVIDVKEYFEINQLNLDKYNLINISSKTLNARLYQIKGDKEETIELDFYERFINETITLKDGVYKLDIFEDESDPIAYSKSIILVSYPTIINSELKFIDMLMNDCIGKDIDYRTFYDFNTFQFLTNLFYKLLSNIENFYYIYNDSIPSNQLYSVANILSRINLYINEYNRK